MDIVDVAASVVSDWMNHPLRLLDLNYDMILNFRIIGGSMGLGRRVSYVDEDIVRLTVRPVIGGEMTCDAFLSDDGGVIERIIVFDGDGDDNDSGGKTTIGRILPDSNHHDQHHIYSVAVERHPSSTT